MNNQESLRKQILDAMNKHTSRMGCDGGANVFNATIFDKAIMPVLKAAMDAGELLVHRATTPQTPVSDAIIVWLEGCCGIIESMQRVEDTVSKRELLTMINQFYESADRAIAEVRGNLFGSQTIPMKG